MKKSIKMFLDNALRNKFRYRRDGIVGFMIVISVLQVALLANRANADAITDSAVTTTAPLQSSSPDKYGLFNCLDHRSAYGVGVFPEPFLNDDSDEEINEFRIDWLHTELHHSVTDLVTGEVEKGFGPLTLEIEVPYEHDTSREFDPATGLSNRQSAQGIGNVDLGGRVPFYQFVSAGGAFDTTFGVGIEVGIPTNSPVSKNTEVVPKIFNDTVIGDHFTVQTILGYSILYGSGDDGGVQTFEYGFTFGWSFPHQQLPIPGMAQTVAVAELSGVTQTNKDDRGHNQLLGDAGFRFNLNAIGRVQPRFGVVYVFPIDQGGRQSINWGIDTSLVFEF